MRSILIATVAFTSICCNTAFADEDTLSTYYEIAKQNCHDITCIRQEMDRVNNEILKLLTERTAYVKRAGDLKSRTTKIADDRKRVADQEKKIINKSIELQLPTEISVPTFRMIMETSIEFQQGYIDQLTKLSGIIMRDNTDTKKDLIQFVLQGRQDFFRSGSLYSPLPGAAFQDNPQAILYCSGMDYAPCNGVMEKNDQTIPTEADIDKTITFFNSRKVPFIWWTQSKILESKGFQFGGILTGIVCDITKDLPSNSSNQIQVKQIQTESDLEVFSQLAVKAFGMEAHVLNQFQAINTSAMEHGEQLHFLAYLNKIPVGTVTLSNNHASAGIWNFATLPEYRKVGIGSALVQAAIIEAKKRQHKQIMAILMPKGMAWGIFSKLGFEEVCQFPFYVYGTSADKLE